MNTSTTFRALRARKIEPTIGWTLPPKPRKSKPPCRSRNRLRYGELTRVILKTVADSGRISPRDLADLLGHQAIRVTRHQMEARLAELSAEGRIAKIGPGLYTKV